MKDVYELLNQLNGVKKGQGEQWIARCPAHDDKNASLSIAKGEKGVVLHCHAGCTTEQITAALGISCRDLFYEEKFTREVDPVVATYKYFDGSGVLIAEKLRKASKKFTWRKPKGGGWEYSRKGVPYALYTGGKPLENVVYVVEGEKDVDSLLSCGVSAVSGMDGAGKGKWKNEYTEQLRGKSVYIIPDHDKVGREYAHEIAGDLLNVAASVYLLDLADAWTEIPEHGDISDMMEALGKEQAITLLYRLSATAKEYEPKADDPFLNCFKLLDDFEEEEATWYVPGWIPENQISTLASDGGVGKTTMWVNILAARSRGVPCLLDPPGYKCDPQLVAFLTTEDSVKRKLRKKLREAGANLKNIITPDFQADAAGALRDLKFGAPGLTQFIRHFRPKLCVFDPLQGFVPPDINMGSRNAMRDCLAPLIPLGEECGTTFLIICHTNKRKGAYGRDRIADSADLWDLSRSVLMAGFTDEQGVRYLSNEKNNYSELQRTVLFTIDDKGQAVHAGTSWKRDREYMQESVEAGTKSKKDDCMEFLLSALREAGGSMPTKELENRATDEGYSCKTVRNAKNILKEAGHIRYSQKGDNTQKAWYVSLSNGVSLATVGDVNLPF